jgi:hypothetical protein
MTPQSVLYYPHVYSFNDGWIKSQAHQCPSMVGGLKVLLHHRNLQQFIYALFIRLLSRSALLVLSFLI